MATVVSLLPDDIVRLTLVMLSTGLVTELDFQRACHLSKSAKVRGEGLCIEASSVMPAEVRLCTGGHSRVSRQSCHAQHKTGTS